MTASINQTTHALPDALPDPPAGITSWQWLIVAAALALTTALGYWGGQTLQQDPATQSAEAGFARDMITHHAQAVQMALLLYDRTSDPEMKLFALDIALTQQAQIGQMQGWLTVWGLPLANTQPAMSWMGMPTTGLMPGMATLDDLNRPDGLSGVEADVLFMQLMIPHHRAAVDMSQYVLDHTQRSEVRSLAESILVGQQNEIDYMQSLLTRKEAAPVPDTPDMPAMSHATPAP